MNLLLDTHLLLWAANAPERLSPKVRDLLLDPDNQLFFSAASLWEITIKNSLARPDFKVDPRRLWRMLLAHDLPPLHKDPFDRILIAQARVEDWLLLTVDQTVVRYGVGIMDVA